MTNIPPRPKQSDAAIVRQVATTLSKEVLKWLEEVGEDDTSNTLVEDLEKAIKFDSDGYAIAKNLDDMSYVPDAALVEILDTTSSLRYEALRQAQIEWVKTNRTLLTEPPIGAKVKWTNAPFSIRQKIAYTTGVGTVANNHEEGKSTVNYPELHKHPSSGYVIPWEELEIIP